MRASRAPYGDSQIALPPASLLPDFKFELPQLHYPSQLNASAVLLEQAIEEGHGDRCCVVTSEGDWTYRELDIHASRFAFFLEKRGVTRGTRVLLRGTNGRFLVAAWLAVLKLGAVAVTVLPSLRTRELAQIIRKAEVSHSVCEETSSIDLLYAADAIPMLRDLLLYDDGGPMASAFEGDVYPACRTRADDIALIAFTSGSTGEPKGCIHLNRDILAIADTFSEHILKPYQSDLFCGTPPLGFTFGLGGLVIFPLRARASTLLVRTPGVAALGAAIERFRPTICFSAPTGYRGLSRLAKECDLSSLRQCVSAGEWLPNETRDMFKAATGIDLIDGIGSTEMLHIFISASGNDVRPGATGKIVPGYEACIVNERGKAVPKGEVGFLAVKGPTGCRYVDDPRQEDYVRAGWNITGDSYYQDEDGYFWFVARSDDMIASAGYKIAGPEIEKALLSHPAVTECAIVGIPDAERGQLVKAWVVPHLDWRDCDNLVEILSDHLNDMIAPYKRPRQFAFIDALPRTETGKIQRFRLREKEAYVIS